MSAAPVLCLGLDVSTTACKALVFEPGGRGVIARGHHAFQKFATPREGAAEQDPAEWIEGVRSAVHVATANIDRSRVKSIAVSGQQHGFVPLDESKRVIRPAKLWCDVESAAEARELSEAYGFELVPGFTASKILWMKRKEPENFAQLRHVLLPHDYINYFLTGRLCMECGDASGSGVFDVHARTFDTRRMEQIDAALPGYFPELLPADQAIGDLTPDAAEALALGTDVVIGPGTGDNMAAALGAGAVTEGILVVSLGTSGTLFGASEHAVWDPSGCIAPFCDATGKWLPLLCTQNCTGVAEEVCRAFSMDHSQLTELAMLEPAGCDGANYLPFNTGERTPNWPHASGALLGLRPGSLRPGLLYRAALEGATFSLFAGLALMRQHGVQASEVRLVGGGAKNPLWRSIVADIFQLPVRLTVESESAALGAALQAAAVHAGVRIADYIMQHPPPVQDEVVQPNPQHASAYQQAFERHQRLGEQLFAH